MTIRDADRLRGLEHEIEDRREALLELELDPTRASLERSSLGGATAAAWATTSAALADAWEAQALLDDRLERLRAGRPEPGDADQPRELLARCAAPVDGARKLLADVARAWDAFVPRLVTANATLRACAELLEELGAPPHADVADVRRALAALTDAVSSDPLSARAEPIGAVEQRIAAVRADVEHLRDFRADAQRRLDDARALLVEARRAETEAREAHRIAHEKIADAELPDPPPVDDGLAERLDRVAGLADDGAWHEAADQLRRWIADATRAREDAQRIATAAREPMALRDELRGRLNAYQAKAQRLRLLEDPELAAVHARAQRLLHTAPADLEQAAALVRRYQEGLSGRSPREVVR